jgi:hypothetical protein
VFEYLRGAAGVGSPPRPLAPRGVDADASKGADRGIPPKPSFPGSAGSTSAAAQQSLTAESTGPALGVCQLSPPVCRLSGASPSGALSSTAFPDVYSNMTRCRLRATHKECSASTRRLQLECRPTNRTLPLGNRLCHMASAALSNVAGKYLIEPVTSLTSQHAMRGRYLPQKSASLQSARQKVG